MALAPAQYPRPGSDVLTSLCALCRLLLHDRAAFDDRYLGALGELLPAGHPLHQAPGIALDLLDVVLGAVLAGEGPERTEAACQECGERCAGAGLPDDVYPVVGRAVARAARDLAGESWSAATSSGWAAVHLWVVDHLGAGASRARRRGEVWRPFPELAPSRTDGSRTDGIGDPWGVTEFLAVPGPAGSGASAEWALLEWAAGQAPPEGADHRWGRTVASGES